MTLVVVARRSAAAARVGSSSTLGDGERCSQRDDKRRKKERSHARRTSSKQRRPSSSSLWSSRLTCSDGNASTRPHPLSRPPAATATAASPPSSLRRARACRPPFAVDRRSTSRVEAAVAASGRVACRRPLPSIDNTRRQPTNRRCRRVLTRDSAQSSRRSSTIVVNLKCGNFVFWIHDLLCD